MPIVVLDTNSVVAALLRGGGTARKVLRAGLNVLKVLSPEHCLDVFPGLP